MADQENLAQQFEAHRTHLRGVAFRMLGSLTEAEDAVQETWLRLQRSEADEIDNLGGWLTTVVARVCLDVLRARKAHAEEPLEPDAPAGDHRAAALADPEQEALLADAVGAALLVVLDTLSPAERLAFVLHDLFGASFDEIASIVGKTPEATRQLASRARRRIQGAPAVPEPDLSRQRRVVDTFLSALRAGDFDRIVSVLHPDLVATADGHAVPAGAPREVRGAQTWARGAVTFARAARTTHAAMIDGNVGLILAPRGKLLRALRLTFEGDTVARIDVVADPKTLASMEIAVLGEN